MGADATQPQPRPVTSLTVSHALKTALQDAGYYNSIDILSTEASDLSTELNVSLEVAQDIIKQCSNPPGPSSPSNAALKSTEVTNGHHIQSLPIQPDANHPAHRFSLGATAIDDLINLHRDTPLNQEEEEEREDGSNGSLRPGDVVEITGPPGIGKSAIAINMALNARLRMKKGKGRKKEVEANEFEVLIIDTEGAVTPDRMFKAATSLTPNYNVSAKEILDGIHLIRVATQVQMIAFLNRLDDWLRDNSKVRLVMVDSLSFHFRQPYLDIGTRRRIMDLVKQQFAKASTVHDCAVIVINQLATKLLSAEGKRVNFDTGEKAVLMPQLGEAWQTANTIKIALFRGPAGNEVRYAHVSTATNIDEEANSEWACFDINSEGLPMDIG